MHPFYFFFVTVSLFVWKDRLSAIAATAATAVTMGTGVDECERVNNWTLICNYIPITVPSGISNVRIVLLEKNQSVVKEMFADTSWAEVESLTFQTKSEHDVRYGLDFMPFCFSSLHSLRELSIHLSSYWHGHYSNRTNVFAGLPNVHKLDLSDNYRILFADLVHELEVPAILPNLRELIIQRIGQYLTGTPQEANRKFFQSLSTRNITNMNFSGLKFARLNLTAFVEFMHTIQHIDLSYTQIQYLYGSHISRVDADAMDVRFLDLSHSIVPSNLCGPTGKQNISDWLIRLKVILFRFISNSFIPKVLNISGIVKATCPSNTFFLRNVALNLGQIPRTAQLEKIIFRSNNVIYIDVHVECKNSTLKDMKLLDFSDNGLEFFNTYGLACLPNLEILNLTQNKLYLMFESNVEVTEALLIGGDKLQGIYLSDNSLRYIPKKLFLYNNNLEIIDLSSNMLEQVSFELNGLSSLRLLNLKRNMIKTLDDASRQILNSLQLSQKPKVLLTGNPLDCASCETRKSVSWLKEAKTKEIIEDDLECRNENGHLVTIGNKALEDVADICLRPVLIGAITTSSIFIIILSVSTTVLIYKRIQWKRMIENIQRGQGPYEYAVLLVYATEDRDFVHKNIHYREPLSSSENEQPQLSERSPLLRHDSEVKSDPLDENLRRLTGIERPLVREIDIAPGQSVIQMLEIYLSRGFVVAVVMSCNFYDQFDVELERVLEQAIDQRKPIIFFLIGDINLNDMPMFLASVYKNRGSRDYTWKEEENGKYKRSHSWDSICKDILNRIAVSSPKMTDQQGSFEADRVSIFSTTSSGHLESPEAINSPFFSSSNVNQT